METENPPHELPVGQNPTEISVTKSQI